MHIRVSTKRIDGKAYRYTQIVQSYRRPDGVPGHRVIANLGDLPTQTVTNLKLALQASGQGKAVVIPQEIRGVSDRTRVQANLRYLDLATVLEMWRDWGLDGLFDQLFADTDSLVPGSKVVAALTLQRCVAPGSKLFAERWFPTTALPELLGIDEEHFNNTRVHRVLRQLHEAGDKVQKRLPELYQSRRGAFAWCAMDVTNAHFVGRGCSLALRGRTKDGHCNQRNIGLVLLCNSEGYPLRWEPVAGNAKDHSAMAQVVGSVQALGWLKGVPVVFDRAMGGRTSVLGLLNSGLHFLTAAHVDAIETYASASALPYEAISSVNLGGTDATYTSDIQRVAEKAEGSGLKAVGKNLLVLDLGVVAIDLGETEDDEPADNAEPKKRTKRKKLLTQLRLVAYFNPRMFVDQRRRAQEHLAEFHRFVDELNSELQNAKQSRKEEPTRRKIIRRLEKQHWVDLFEVELSKIQVGAPDDPVDSFHCKVRLNSDAWARRQRYNGFVLLLGHPKLSQSAGELALMYRAKDIIEKDFQIAKSVTELRPIFHYTDPKVQAHITLCMLALLLQRTLEHRLRGAQVGLTAGAALETLGTCHLNQMKAISGECRPYSVTEPTRTQREILQALQLSHLADDAAVSRSITPRAPGPPQSAAGSDPASRALNQPRGQRETAGPDSGGAIRQ